MSLEKIVDRENNVIPFLRPALSPKDITLNNQNRMAARNIAELMGCTEDYALAMIKDVQNFASKL